jgi:hypothetical protein
MRSVPVSKRIQNTGDSSQNNIKNKRKTNREKLLLFYSFLKLPLVFTALACSFLGSFNLIKLRPPQQVAEF